MEALVDWLPRIGAIITVIIGLVGFFKPRLITDSQQIELGSAMAVSEARVALVGCTWVRPTPRWCCTSL
jgi:hypothetical protein